MEKQPHVLLLGESVLMDSVAANLEKRECHQVFRIRSDAREAQKYVHSTNPDLIVYELNDHNVAPVLTMIRNQADTTHLAIDLDSEQVILLNCQRKPTRSMQALCDLVYQNFS